MSDFPERFSCLKCGRVMNNLQEDGVQPLGGLDLSTRGHYGSSFFDPMDGTCLHVLICDGCLIEGNEEGGAPSIVRSRTVRTVETVRVDRSEE